MNAAVAISIAAEIAAVVIEEPFSGQFSSVKALFPMLGAAILTFELEGLPWSTVHLAKLKIHATGKGNAKEARDASCGKRALGCRLEGR
jgi:Holliday junction resolvasome RuvABC endonuclease subunit